MAGDTPGWFFFLQALQKWQKIRGQLFNEAAGFDKDKAIKEQAGVKNLNKYSNDYEILNLCELLNSDFESVLESNDVFCTKILLSNLEKSNFESRYFELKQKRLKGGSRK